MGSSENSGQTQNFVIFNGFISSMTLQLLLSDNAYPKEETGGVNSLVQHCHAPGQAKPRSSQSFSKLPSWKAAFASTE